MSELHRPHQNELHQDAWHDGHDNIPVQIVCDGSEVTVSSAKELRLTRYDMADYASAVVEPEQKNEPGYTATGRRESVILSPYNRESLPFQGRQALGEALTAWRDGPEQVSIHAVIGGGGRGKTRLAVQLVDAAHAAGWTAGFAKARDLELFGGHGYRWFWDKPTLMVIDYAGAKAVLLRRWLRTLVNEEQRDRPPMRLLLLDRFGGSGIPWWTSLFAEPDREGVQAGNLLSPGAPLELTALSSPAERHAVFAAAHGAASTFAVPPATDALDKVLMAASLGGEPLFLAMFGLVAARQGLVVAQSLTADRIAMDLADQELLRIGKVWQAHGLSAVEGATLHAHLAAAASLCEGLSANEAHRVIARESAALHQAVPEGQTGAALAALYAALPGPDGGVAPIRPDILGEAAALLAFGRLPDQGVAAVGRLAEGKRKEVAASVMRACQDYLIRQQPLPLRWLETLRTGVEELGTLTVLSNAIPHDTLELREFAAELLKTVRDLSRNLPGEEGTAILAAALNNLSVRLSALGRGEEALAASKEAVELRRSLVAFRPDTFLPDLAGALSNLSNRLSNIDNLEEALAASEEAVELRRSLVASRPDTFLPDLASALSNLSVRLWALGRREEALVASEEAVELHRSLAASRPDAFLPDLATSLNNLSNRLSNLGRREEALTAIEEAVRIRRSLVASRPDTFLPDLGSSLNNLSNRFSALGRHEEALTAIEEAIRIYHSLAVSRPDAFLPDLASSLNNLSNRFSALGRREKALAASEKAVRIYRSLAAACPQSLLPDHAGALNNLSNRFSALGRHEEALAASEDAVGIYRSLATARPQAFLPGLASSLNNMSVRHSALGRREEALAVGREAVGIYRSLAASHPDAFLPDLAGSLNNMSVRLLALGHREEALTTINEAVGMRRSLAASRPDAFLPDLAGSLNNMSGCLTALGRCKGALAVSEEAIGIYRSLAASHPDAFLPDLAGSLGSLSRIYRALSQYPEASRALAEAIRIIIPFLQVQPQGFARLGIALIDEYKAACEADGRTPEKGLLLAAHELLKPILKQMRQSDSDHGI